MTGELWRQQWEVGKEITPGTSVASTRLMYFDEGSKLIRERTGRMHKFATGGRQNQLVQTNGPEMVSGQVSQPLSASEIIELLLMGVSSGVTPTRPDSGGNPTVYLWAFTPGTALQAATVRHDDAARPWQGAGLYVDKLKISGNVREGNTVSADLFGFKMIQQALTGSLTPRTPDFIEGWETKFYIDALGATPGTTNIAGTLINWDIEIDNQLSRKFWADNVNAAEGIIPGEIKISAKLLFEASPSTSLTEYNDWDAVTNRLLRLEFGQNTTISGAYKKFVTLDLPGAWNAVDLSQSDEGTRAYEFTLDYLYDSTNTFGLQIRAQNARSAAW
jgi:hypothetical protein